MLFDKAFVRRTSVTSGVLLATCFAGSSAVAEALEACALLTAFSPQEYPLEDSTTLSVSGFEASVNYVAVPADSPRVLKITSASEDPVISAEGGALTISAVSCDVSLSPTASPTTSAARTATDIMAPLLAFAHGGIWSFAVTAFLSLLTGAYADGDVCLPTIDIEISVPTDCPYNNIFDGKCMTPEMIADLTIQALFVDFDTEASGKLLAEDYIQHNPGVPTGAAPVLEFIPFLKSEGLGIETHRAFAEGPLVAYHSTYTNASAFGGETLIGFDIFRVEDGKVQEHWDNLQDLRGPTPSGNTMTDGPTMIKYLSETDANKALVVSLIETVLIGGNFSALTDFISTETYTQHNPDIADGLDGLAAGVADLSAAGLDLIYHKIEIVIAEGNFVLTASSGELGAGNATAYYDLFRLQDGLIVEHWDVIQAIPPEAEFAHTNGKF